MEFRKAFELLQQGFPIKRKEWDGYWILKEEDIIIHLKEGSNLNLLDTDNVMFTLSHTTQGDWEVATLSNCKRLREDNER